MAFSIVILLFCIWAFTRTTQCPIQSKSGPEKAAPGLNLPEAGKGDARTQAEEMAQGMGLKDVPGSVGCIYVGKHRSQKWLDDMYAKFSDQIALFEGQYLEICKAVAEDDVFGMGTGVTPPQIGLFQVLSIINNTEIVVFRKAMPMVLLPNGRETGWVPGMTLHIKGVESANLVDGQNVTETLLPGGSSASVGTSSRT